MSGPRKMAAVAADNRLITSSGEYGARQTKTGSLLFSSDVYGLLAGCNWLLFVVVFASLFVVSWTAFAWLWYVVAYAHGDLGEPAAAVPCVKGLAGFSDALFFSVDLQSTMGYGRAEIHGECPAAVVLFFVQCLAGIFVQSTAVTLLFTKFSSRSGTSDRHGSVCFPERLKLVKVDRNVDEDGFQDRRHDHSKSYDNLTDLSRPKFKKYGRNPHAKTGKLRRSKNKDKVAVSPTSDYLLRFEFETPKELMSVTVHALMMIKRVTTEGKETTKMEITATKSVQLFGETTDGDARRQLCQSDHSRRYVHSVDRYSPLRPYLLSMMKPKKMAEKAAAAASPHRALKPSLSPSSLARSLENLREEVLRMRIPEFELVSPVKNFIVELTAANHSCDDASVESDAAADVGRTRHKKHKTKHKASVFKSHPNPNAGSPAGAIGRLLTGRDVPGSSASSISGHSTVLAEKEEEGGEVETAPKPEESARLELAFVVEGTEAETGTLVEARTSYILEDIVPDF